MIEAQGIGKVLENLRTLPARTRKATSRAVNDTLKDVQNATGQEILPDAFTLRGRGKQWWEPGQKFGFNIRPYSKPETLEGVIGSQASWLEEQERGGTRTRASQLAIPASDYKPRDSIMLKRLKPRAVTRKKNVFFAELKSGFVGIFQRLGIDTPLKLLFSLKTEARYRPILNFEKKAAVVAEKRFPVRFAVRFLEVLK